jgi:hypothetical protein
MKFGWLDLFASRMSSYLNVLFTRWLQVDTLDRAGPIKAWSVFCLLFSWAFVDCSVRSSVLGSCMGFLTCTYFTHNKVLSIISALFFNPNLGFLPGSIWIWKKYQNLVFQMKIWMQMKMVCWIFEFVCGFWKALNPRHWDN